MVRFVACSVVVAVLSGGVFAPVGSANEAANELKIISDWWLREEEGAVAWSSDEFVPPHAAQETTILRSGNIRSPALDSLQPYEGGEFENDASMTPVQFMSPQFRAGGARQPVGLAQSTPRPATRAATATGLASVPYMIGDTGAGTCLGFSGIVDAMLSHPTLSCGRLNIAEANSPLPTDRLYYSYRHFHNTSTVSAYQFSETLDVDRHTIAWEHTFWDGTGSVELRLPLEDRLQSDIFSILAPSFGVVDPLVAPGDGRQVELGNINAIFKLLLVERETFAVSGGLGVTLPTARDVNYQLAVDGEVEFMNSPGLTADEAVAFQGVFANETVYLSPFLAWLYAPSARSRWFHQGFMQVEVAANPSRVTFDGDGATLFLQNGVPIGFYDYFTPVPVRADLFSQTLMRVNLGVGYELFAKPQAAMTALFEMHYTTTLQDANLSEIPLTTQASAGTVPLQSISVGNLDNRVDIVNAAAGVSNQIGRWIVTNGFVAPVKKAPDRGFDFEYNLQVQRPF